MLYHYQIGFPKHIKFSDIFGLRPSAHALAAANTDRYGQIPMPSNFRLADGWRVVEIETENGLLVKVVARRALDAERDIVMAFIPSQRLIKTVWINEKADRHRTLDRARYMTP